MDIISELQRRKTEYVKRYKDLYTQYYAAEKMSDEAKGRYFGRAVELSYTLIDIFGMTGRDLQQIEDLIKDKIDKERRENNG